MAGRLSLAVDNGHVVLPDGAIVVIEPREDSDLSPLDSAETVISTRFATVAARFQGAGWTVNQEVTPAGAVVVLPRARDAQKACLRRARSLTDGPIIVDGDKTDGVDAILKECRKRAEVSDAWSKAHGKVFTITGGRFDDWPELEPTEGSDGWWRAPGVFSGDGVDKASAFLADALPKDLKGRVVDLGAGWGYLTTALLDRPAVTQVDMVENDALALDAAQRNITDARAGPHWADALNWVPETPVDHVVTNPPFHVGRATDPKLGQGFIRAAAAMLKPRGQLWLVANRHLPYEETLKDAFRTLELHAETSSFKIFHASSPNRRKG